MRCATSSIIFALAFLLSCSGTDVNSNGSPDLAAEIQNLNGPSQEEITSLSEAAGVEERELQEATLLALEEEASRSLSAEDELTRRRNLACIADVSRDGVLDLSDISDLGLQLAKTCPEIAVMYAEDGNENNNDKHCMNIARSPQLDSEYVDLGDVAEFGILRNNLPEGFNASYCSDPHSPEGDPTSSIEDDGLAPYTEAIAYIDLDPNRIDTNQDGLSDYTTYQRSDFDGDGVLNVEDNCLTISNPEQVDSDGDGMGDACEDLECASNFCQDNGFLSGYHCDGASSVRCAINSNGCSIEASRILCTYGCQLEQVPTQGLCLAPPQDPSAPRITSTGVVEGNGSTLSFSGHNFGTHSGLDEIWFLGGQDGWIESTPVGTDPVQAPNTKRFYSSQGQGDHVSNNDAWSGNQSINLRIDGEENYQSWSSTWAYKYPKPGGFRKIYASFWYKMDVEQFPSPTNQTGHPFSFKHKFVNVTSDTTSGCSPNSNPLINNNVSLHWSYKLQEDFSMSSIPLAQNLGNLGCGMSDFLYESATAVGYTKPEESYFWAALTRGETDLSASPQYNFDFGAWNRVDIWMDHGDWDIPNGSVRIKVVKPSGQHAGQQIGLELEDVIQLNTGEDCLTCFPASERDSFIWDMYFAVTSLHDHIEPIVNNFVDDPYIQVGTQARVELGNQPNYSDCTKLEMQKPITWSNESISIELNHGGSFRPGESAYLFVIREDGKASTGRSITVY